MSLHGYDYKRWAYVTADGGKSHHTEECLEIPISQRHSTEDPKVTNFSRDVAHSDLCCRLITDHMNKTCARQQIATLQRLRLQVQKR